MGSLATSISVTNPQDRTQVVVIPSLLVDSGSELTWVRTERLRPAKIQPVRTQQKFELADGSTVARDVGWAIIQVGTFATIDEVVFANANDKELLGVHTLEGLRLLVDPHGRRLVFAGPALAATPQRKSPAKSRPRGGGKGAAAVRPLTGREWQALKNAEVIECEPVFQLKNLRKDAAGKISLHAHGPQASAHDLDALEVHKLEPAVPPRRPRRKTPQTRENLTQP